ncbi:hypothetical protein OS493_037112 [Desmophyllum pertusum]|uniref:Apple domain-containing protein n=1 Tax=Desmophyllum pertusum TaxID=174260 RepID=A0A9X0CHS0_9CNID|nr:hypothetical protein OS493_037112 [Desmophyllum pertusum]
MSFNPFSTSNPSDETIANGRHVIGLQIPTSSTTSICGRPNSNPSDETMANARHEIGLQISTSSATRSCGPPEKTCQCRHGAAEEANHHDLYPVFCNGRVHYAFLEVCAKLFPGLPIQTVKSRMRNLGLKLLKCPSDKQDSIRKARPNLACYKTLSLLSEQDVSTLEAYHDTRTRQKLFAGDELNENNNCCSANSKFKGERNSSVTDAEQITLDPKQATVGAGPAVRSAASTSFLVENLLKPTPPKPSPSIYPIDVSDSSDSEKEFGQMPNEETAYSSDESECNCEQSDEETKHLSKTDEIFRYLRIKKVDESKFRTVINSLVEMREFYLSQTNFKRRQPRMSPSTWSKTLERLITFLVFCQATLKLSPDLGLVENMHVVESFIMYLKNERRVKSSTAARYVFVLTVTAKFLHAEESRQNYEQVESISDLRALTTQLEKENSMLDAKVPQRNRLFWPQFQELTRSLHCQYEDASPRSKEQARIHMDFTLLLLFAINPGRAKEFRTLRVLSDVEDAELDQKENSFEQIQTLKPKTVGEETANTTAKIRETNANRDGRHFIGGISTKFDHILIGHKLKSLQTRGMIECAQKCLSIYPQCGSINYHITKHRCELNEWGTEQSIIKLVYRKGFVFVLLL